MTDSNSNEPNDWGVPKGQFVALLIAVGSGMGFLMTKGRDKDLTSTDILGVVSDLVIVLKEFEKEPSFAARISDVSNALRELEALRDETHPKYSANPLSIVRGAAKSKLLSDLKTWYDLIMDLVHHHLFSTLSEDSVGKLFPQEVIDKCGVEDFKDVIDGFACLMYGVPTPGAVILLRAAERESRKFYKSITQEDPPDKWQDLINKLRAVEIVPPSLLNYMDFIRSKRNDSAHAGRRTDQDPVRRYTQEESEGVLQQLSYLMKEIYAFSR